MDVEIVTPSAGESVTEGEIAEWLVAVGDAVKADDVVVLIETDKITVELPAPVGGTLKEIRAQVGEKVGIGQVIGIIDSDGRPAAKEPSAEKPAAEPEQPPAQAETKAEAKATPVSPAARKLAEDKGVDVASVEGSGKRGAVTKADVQAAAGSKPAAPAKAPAVAGDGPRAEERVRLSPLRKRIAERLMESQKGTATLTTFNEIDMSAAMALRKRHNDEFQKRYGIKLGFMSMFAKASIEALKAFPAVNARIEADEVVYCNYYDLGVAVSTDRGLVVPVIRNAERLSFAETEVAVAELGARARDGKLTIEELTGGTFSISNGGVFGSLMSTPILNPPQSGILGLHKIEKRPVVIEGDQIVVRPMMYVALSYDHRIIDGREAVSFLVRVKECMEDPTRILLEV